MNLFEIFSVTILFMLYFFLWKIKKIIQKKTTGINPEVMAESTSNIQKYMNQLMNIMTIYAVIIIVFHSTGFQYASLFSRYEFLNNLLCLSLCCKRLDQIFICNSSTASTST
jgi:hypothetical protein